MRLAAILHVLAAVLATWRLVDLVTLDRISESLRRRYPWYLLRCPRCLSVWMGAAATVAFVLCPWLNYPLALSWCYLWRIETREARRRRDALAQENRSLRAVVASLGAPHSTVTEQMGRGRMPA